MNNELDSTLQSLFSAAQQILIVSHVRPDGDAIGSLLGLGLALQNAGKSVQMILTDGVPRSFRHLVGSQLVQRRPTSDYDLSVVVDCSDLLRIGDLGEGFTPDIVIDHHITNQAFGRFNLVEPEAVATAAILTQHLPEWGLEITQPAAAALLTGLVADTIGFRTSNMTPHALRLAADLMEKGADLPELYQQALVRRSFEAVCYWGQGLTHIQRKDRLVWTTLSLQDRQRASYFGNDDADLVNVLSGIDDADVAVMFIEQRDDKVKVSWRAQPGVDVSKIAFSFGGGGHAAAAGAEIQGSLEEVQNRVLSATQEMLAAYTINGNGKKSLPLTFTH